MIKKSSFLPLTLAGGLLLTAAASLHAQATRTWVSGVGDDVNPCSRTAPGKTFAGAISKTAAGGEINVLDPGGFGTLTITKSITIDGSGGSIAGVVAPGTNGIIINAGATDSVTLRNLDLNGLGTGLTGVNILQAGLVRIENCQIYGFTQGGVKIVNTSPNVRVTIVHCVLRNNTGGAVYSMPPAGHTAQVVMEKSVMTDNQFGLRADAGSFATVNDSVASGGAAHGFLAYTTDATPATISLNHTVSTLNGTNGAKSQGPAATVVLNGVSITGNNTGLSAVSGGVIASCGNNAVLANTPGGDGAPTMMSGTQ